MVNVELELQEDKKKILKRLKRIEGQVRGLQKMIEEEKSCEDVLIQLAAVEKAIDKTGVVIAETYLKQCLLKEGLIEPDKKEKLDAALKILRRIK